MRREIEKESDGTIHAASIAAVRVWERLGRGNGSVRALRWEADGILRTWCGGREGAPQQGVEIHDGRLAGVDTAKLTSVRLASVNIADKMSCAVLV